NHIVPIAVEVVALDFQRAQFFGGHLLAGWVSTAIEPGADDEPTAVRRIRDQVDDGLIGAQWSAAPVDGYEREQAVLDLVTLACSRRKVADMDREVELVGEPLQLVLPHVRAIAVAAAGVGCDEEVAGVRITPRAD